MITLIANQRDILAISSPGLGVIIVCVYGIMKVLCLDAATEPGLKAIILLPTRELAILVYDTCERLRPAHKFQVQVKIFHSDHSTSDEASEWFDIVVGTPGKDLGAVQSGALSPGSKNVIISTNRLDGASGAHQFLPRRPWLCNRAVGEKHTEQGNAFQRGQCHAVVMCRLFYAGVDNSEIQGVAFYTRPPTITHTITGRLRLAAAGGEMITILDPEAKEKMERMKNISRELCDLQSSNASVLDNPTGLRSSLNSSTAACCKLIIRGIKDLLEYLITHVKNDGTPL
ncbi:P-loop containing nucleoside triphosphate hydrolase protein [Aspergillus terreus]|uniref:P-loop containing nucleoside triphosphate hydrolase protein n=1 Tax=Aspergillus terreus TaxID=33178 RepID=A0A5M3ZDX1_ASPTE|nr:hypothetical protein ATETN484_0012043700 [Aspergillus terreus]GFF19675.1 P-loop containing nucleoside triphosphate hydrolase protein [Aspergillus terreus]